jgi:hypothetical protein
MGAIVGWWIVAVKNKGIIAAIVGLSAGLLVGAGYALAFFSGVQIPPAMLSAAAAVLAFAASTAVLTLVALGKPEAKKEPSTLRLRDLKDTVFTRFPKRGASKVLYLTVQQNTVIRELDIYENPASYEMQDIFLIIKKARGKDQFNPVVLKELFVRLSGFLNFVYILLVNDHDDYQGFIPAAFAKMNFTSGDAESRIRKYVIDVLDDPENQSSLDHLRDIKGLSVHDCIFDHEPVSAALERVAGNILSGLIVFKGRGAEKGYHKPLGIVFTSDLVAFAQGLILKPPAA